MNKELTTLEQDILNVLNESENLQLPPLVEKCAAVAVSKILRCNNVEDKRNIVSETFDRINKSGTYTDLFEVYRERISQLLREESQKTSTSKSSVRVKLGNIVNTLHGLQEGTILVVKHNISGNAELVLVEGLDGQRGAWLRPLTMKNQVLCESKNDSEYVPVQDIRSGQRRTFFEASLVKKKISESESSNLQESTQVPTISRQQADLTPDSFDRFSTEASTLGWRAGQWPEQFKIEPTIGNGQPFVRTASYKHGGEFAGYLYTQANGSIKIVVYND